MPLACQRTRSPLRTLCGCARTRFQHLGLLSRGGMAELHLGRTVCCGAQRRVAVKTLPATARPRTRAAFLHECQLSLRIEHANVVAGYEAGIDGRGLYLVLDAIAGFDLRHIQRRREPLPHHLAVYVVARAAEGLHAAHELVDRKTGRLLEVVHCDVSPQNVMVGLDGVVKICDFGVARSRLIEPRMRVSGKPRYLSPEQCLHSNRPRDSRLDRRTDIFSLGLVLYELLSRRTVFSSLPPNRVTDVSRFVFAPLRGIDSSLTPIAMTAIEVERCRRHQTARSLQLALDRWLDDRYPKLDHRSALQLWLRGHSRSSRHGRDTLSAGGEPRDTSFSPSASL